MLFKKVCEPSLTALNPPTPGNHSPLYHLFVTKALVPFKIVTFLVFSKIRSRDHKFAL